MSAALRGRVGTVGGSARALAMQRGELMGRRSTYPRSIVLTGIAVMVCGPLLRRGRRSGRRRRDHDDNGRSEADHDHDDNDEAGGDHDDVGPGEHDNDGTGDNDHCPGPGARRPVDDHDHGAAARRQPAQHQRADATRRGDPRQGRAVPEQQWRDVAGDRAERPELPELPGRAVSLRLQRTGHSHARRQRRLQARALHCVPRSRRAVELRCDGRRQNAKARVQRRAPRDRVAGTRAGIRRAQPAPDLRARDAGDDERRRRMEPGRCRAIPEPRRRHREAAGSVRHLHPARHAPGRVQPELPGRRCSRLGRLHEQRPDRSQGWSVVEQLLEPDPADGGGPFLEQRRGGEPPGQL